MNHWIIIAKKDFKTIVFSPMFLVIAGFCTALWSYNYLRAIILFAQTSAFQTQMGQATANIHQGVFLEHISLVNLILIFAVPAITMSLIAEEKKSGTFSLLLTLPITATEIAIGKFFAGFMVSLALVAISFLYPLGTTFVADIHWGPLLSSYLGLIFVLGTYVALGLFASSLSRSVVLSVILGVAFNLCFWFVGYGSQLSSENWLSKSLEHISLPHQFFTFLKGTIGLQSCVFFLSFMILFIFLSQRVIESARWR